MRIFVTGGTGLLGNTIIRQLIDEGYEVTALVRQVTDPRVFQGIQLDLVQGDLLDAPVIEHAVRQCDAVIHSAGLIHIGWHRLDESMRVNRDGTRVIAEACLRHDRKLVHVGSVNTLAIGSRRQAASEQTPLDHEGGQVPCAYVTSKRAGVEEVLRKVNEGLRAAVVHPGFMLGPWDWKPSSGRMTLEIGRRWRPICPRGGCSVCDSRDVAAATIAAIERGGDQGRQFILAGENLTYKELWSELARRMNRKGPIMRAGPLQLWIASRAGDAWYRLTGNEGDVNSASVRMTTQYHWYRSERAQAELGYCNRDINESLDASASWIREYHTD